MIRTQIQLTGSQVRQLKEIARRRGVPLAALLREGADLVIRSGGMVDMEDRRRRAIAAAGRFHSGQRDLAAAHDQYLAETLNK